MGNSEEHAHFHKILIVENDSSQAEELESFLTRGGIHVKTALNGIEAIALLKYWEPHTIVYSMEPPVSIQIDVLQYMKRLCPQAKIILCIAEPYYKDDDLKPIEAHVVMLKPVYPSQLLKLIKGL